MRIPPVKPEKILKLLVRLGFEIKRRKGSHVILYNKDIKKRIVVPVHFGKELKPGLVKLIIKEVGLSQEEFLRLLKEI